MRRRHLSPPPAAPSNFLKDLKDLPLEQACPPLGSVRNAASRGQVSASRKVSARQTARRPGRALSQFRAPSQRAPGTPSKAPQRTQPQRRERPLPLGPVLPQPRPLLQRHFQPWLQKPVPDRFGWCTLNRRRPPPPLQPNNASTLERPLCCLEPPRELHHRRNIKPLLAQPRTWIRGPYPSFW